MHGTPKENRNHIYDYIRIFSCLLVIGIHCYSGNFKLSDTESYIYNFIHSIVRIGLPMFILLSGVLLLNSEKEEKLSNYYYKRFVKIIVPFILVYVYGVPDVIFKGVNVTILFNMATVCVGEIISCCILGTVLLQALGKYKHQIFGQCATVSR